MIVSQGGYFYTRRTDSTWRGNREAQRIQGLALPRGVRDDLTEEVTSE